MFGEIKRFGFCLLFSRRHVTSHDNTTVIELTFTRGQNYTFCARIIVASMYITSGMRKHYTQVQQQCVRYGFTGKDIRTYTSGEKTSTKQTYLREKKTYTRPTGFKKNI